MTVNAMFKVAASGLFVFSCAAMAQDMQRAQIKKEISEFNEKQFVFHTFSDTSPSKIVTEAPYSADEKSITTQTLADGNRIVTSSSARLYRDREGRSRTDKSFDGFQVVTIDDPVAGERYLLDEKNRTAEKIAIAKSTRELAAKLEMVRAAEKMSTGKSNPEELLEIRAKLKMAKRANEAKADKQSGPPLLNGKSVDLKTEDLGTQIMEGVSVQGTRTVLTIPAGQIGNDRSIAVTTERWFSPELQIVIMSKRSDPRLGETLYSITNISRANPDLSLFQVPAGYSESVRRQ